MDERISIKREYDEICDKNSSHDNLANPQLKFLKCEGGSIHLNPAGDKELGIHLVNSDNVIKLQTVRFNKKQLTDSSNLTSSRSTRKIKKNRQSIYHYDEEFESDSKSSRKRSFNEMMSGSISESDLKNTLLSRIAKTSSDKSTQCDLYNRDFSLDAIASELQVMNSLFRAEMMQLNSNRKHQGDSMKQQKLKIVKKNRNKGGTLEIVVGDVCS